MYVIDVIPIAKGMSKEHLSYFTSKRVSPGSLVSVPLRKKIVTAIVIHVDSAASRKTELKSSSYSIRKVEELHASSFLDHAFIQAATETAQYFATHTGRVLNALLPSPVMKQSERITRPRKSMEKVAEAPGGTYLLQTQPEERHANYKSSIREAFANSQSIFFCLPTVEDIHQITTTFEKGIEQYTYVLHSNITDKELRRRWNAILSSKHPVLIVATPLFLSVPRHDIHTMILERESTGSYKQTNAPFIDTRVFAEYLAAARGTRLLLGDSLLRVETLWRHNNNEYDAYTPLKYRSLTSSQTALVDMREEEGADTEAGFRLFSDRFVELLEHTHEYDEHMFIYASRRGLSPITVCGDCGTPVNCPHCESPVTLHKPDPNKDEYNFFQCHKCGFATSAHTTCATCGGWRLSALGIGSQRVADSIKQLLPSDHVFIIDKDHTKTHAQALKVIDAYYAKPGAVLVGTDMGLLYLSDAIENIAVASLDSLFSIPDFRMSERITGTLTHLRTLAKHHLLVQTRQADQPALTYGLEGDLLNFFRDEITMRKHFSYPPFSTLIKITRRGKQDNVEKDMRALEHNIPANHVTVYPSSQTTKQRYVMNALIKVPSGQWIDEQLCSYLRSLPPQYIISVDPQHTL